MHTPQISTDFDHLVMRLERCQNSAKKLNQSFDSYRFEPKDYEAFLELKELRARIMRLIQNQKDLVRDMQSNAIDNQVANSKVTEVISRFCLLETDVASYLRKCG